MSKPVYVPTVAEAALTVDRPTAWAALIALLEVGELADTTRRRLGAVPVVESVISLEAPWRLVLDADTPPCTFHQETIVLVPDQRGCLAMWSALVLEPTDATAAEYADAVAVEVPRRLADLVDRAT
ncbi:MAG: hypothetical protein ACR2QE_06645 [Acidimicrobiales bacterium]